ncbi:MAG: LacI family DNA-binding transcriptional regulator [Flavobacteriales bacterium]
MQKRATIKDIAKALDISVSTVSRGLRDHPDISKDMCQLIKDKAKELNYHPNHIAAGLRKRSSKIIALIIPEISMFFFPSVIKGVEEVARENGYQLLVLQSNDDLEHEKRNIQMCLDHSVEGILISLSNKTSNIDHLINLPASGIPVVFFDKSIENSPFDEVVIDDEDVAFQAVKNLVHEGCKNIAIILGNENLLITKRRERGARLALVNANVEATFVYAESFNKAQIALADYLSSHHPDGMFLMSDELMAAASQPLSGKDCLVVGISDGMIPEIVNFPLKYFYHSGFEIGKLAASKLVHRILMSTEGGQNTPAERIILDVKMHSLH